MSKATGTRKLFLHTCGCGVSFEVAPGKAGYRVQCPDCQETHEIVSYRKLNSQFKSVERTIQSGGFFQFRMLHLFLAFIPCALASLIADIVGVPPVLAFFGGLLVCFSIVFLMALVIHNTGFVAGRLWQHFERK